MRAVVERMEKDMVGVSAESTNAVSVAVRKSEGKESVSAVGCNANNGNPSSRTVNCNNGLGNGNSNYSGAFAVNNGTKRNRATLTSCAASTKIKDGRAATGGYGRCDYDSLPFMCDEIAESNATATDKDAVFDELQTANNKRKLKNLKHFFINRTLIEYAFDRTVEGTNAKSDIVDAFVQNKSAICNRIERELTEQTYTPEPSHRRVIHKKGKGDKDRNADVFVLYDRVIQMLILIVIEKKFRNMMLRNIYSGIKGRSLLSNDKRYCMINKIRHWVKGHRQAWVGLTDIYHFYENLRMKIVLGEMFHIIVCPYTRWLLLTAFKNTEYLPIGGCLSQIMAMFTVVSADRELLRTYNVTLFCFGDNRLICGKKTEVRKAMSFLMSYYEGRYCLSVKADYQIRKVADGFRFCKYDYKDSFVKIRAEIRRRSIRAHKRGLQHYAGYKGIFDKTDSKRLQSLIETMQIVNRHGMTVRTQRGEKKKLRDLKDDTVVVPVEYKIEKSMAHEKSNDEDDALMVRLTYIALHGNQKRLYHTTEGSEEIVGFFQLVDSGDTQLHQKLHITKSGTKVAFTEYHTTAEEACDIICKELGI